jgi:polysaccharide deacetylase family protein (PEP-CTERM system associated)
MSAAALASPATMALSFPAKAVLSVDVEDWFHILELPGAPDLAAWSRLPSRVENNFHRLLELFRHRGARVTCFFLGWIAERFPHLVREAAELGHEIASHGYAHTLAHTMTPQAFNEDVRRTKLLLEDLSGVPVSGFRAPGFSVTAAIPWFFPELEAAGYRYDSSVFPAARQHGGWIGADFAPHRAPGTEALVEFPVSTLGIFGRRFCAFGGGYLRLLPDSLVVYLSRRVLAERRPVVFYVHPREIDPQQPRLPMSWPRRFKSYINLDTTERKLRRLLDEFEVTSFQRLLESGLPDAACHSPMASTNQREGIL